MSIYKTCPHQSILAFLLVFLVGIPDVSAQTFPNRPLRIVVGFVAGGGADTIARLIGPKMTEFLGQPVIVENRPGGATSISIDRVVQSSPDGYTLLLMNPAGVSLPATRNKLSYNLERDLTPVTLVSSAPYILAVNPKLEVRSVKELISLAGSKPEVLSYGTSGAGSLPHLMGELLNLMAQVKIKHVPYKGGAQSVLAVVSNEVHMSFPSIPVALPLMEAGRIRPLAVTSAKRTSLLSSLPTISESGLSGYDLSAWYGILVPAGTSKAVVSRLNTEIIKTLRHPDISESFRRQGMDVVVSTPEQFSVFIRSELEKYGKLIKAIGIQKQ